MNLTSKVINVLFYFQLLLHSVVYVFILSFYLIVPIPFCSAKKNRSRTRNAIRLYGLWLIKFALFPYARVKYINSSYKEIKPCIFICNHRSASDPYLMALLGTELVQIVNRWPFKIPFYGYFAKKAEYISIHDLSYDEFLKSCSNLLDDKVSIVAFPEGTRSANRELGQFGSSIFKVAYKNKAVIYPICIVGNENIPNRNFVITPGKIKIKKLDPIQWNDYKNMKPFQLKKYVRDIILKETARMENC